MNVLAEHDSPRYRMLPAPGEFGSGGRCPRHARNAIVMFRGRSLAEGTRKESTHCPWRTRGRCVAFVLPPIVRRMHPIVIVPHPPFAFQLIGFGTAGTEVPRVRVLFSSVARCE